MKKNWDTTEELAEAIRKADAIVIGAGAGLSTSAGFEYGGETFRKNFGDFEEKYGFHDMYSGGFYPFPGSEEKWAYWSRFIDLNRYHDAPRPVYEQLLELVKDKEYFVLTTNVDHCFQKAGFDKDRLFYTQGDYGLFQCSEPCHEVTYDNETIVKEMVARQKDGRIPAELIPHCPVCGREMSMNLRADDTFVEDAGWHEHARLYQNFLEKHAAGKENILFLELGVGGNTPSIIKYPFWRMTLNNPRATYACLNYREAFVPKEIEEQSICIDGDIGQTLTRLQEKRKARGQAD